MSDTREDHGLGNALAWFGSIKEMVEALEAPDDDGAQPEFQGDKFDSWETVREAARDRIHESILSVEMRGGWLTAQDYFNNPPYPAEYRILLTTGGPGLQLTGSLDEHGQPETAELQHQDWFKPWTAVRPVGAPADQQSWDAILLTFAQQFYFGEG